jgi:hypothetical protein
MESSSFSEIETRNESQQCRPSQDSMRRTSGVLMSVMNVQKAGASVFELVALQRTKAGGPGSMTANVEILPCAEQPAASNPRPT